jgi:tellurite resistance protein
MQTDLRTWIDAVGVRRMNRRENRDAADGNIAACTEQSQVSEMIPHRRTYTRVQSLEAYVQ